MNTLNALEAEAEAKIEKLRTICDTFEEGSPGWTYWDTRVGAAIDLFFVIERARRKVNESDP